MNTKKIKRLTTLEARKILMDGGVVVDQATSGEVRMSNNGCHYWVSSDDALTCPLHMYTWVVEVERDVFAEPEVGDVIEHDKHQPCAVLFVDDNFVLISWDAGGGKSATTYPRIGYLQLGRCGWRAKEGA